ncbi:hypothetical protein ACHAXS_007311, partial [Conticribra weissflogii]
DNVMLSGCGNLKLNQELIEKLTGKRCEIGKEKICKLRPRTSSSLKKRANTAVVCSIVSNEEAYLDEWIDYHLGIGFDHIYLYDNTAKSELGHGWLDRRPRLINRVTVAAFPGQSMQVPAFKDCTREYALRDGHRLVAHFDADEFLVLRNHSNVVDLLQDYCKNGAVSLNWQVMTWNNELQYRPQPVVKRFQGVLNYSDVINHHVKTITNAKHINLRSNDHHPHYPILKRGYHQVDTDGVVISTKWRNVRYRNDVGVFYHFWTKSWKEYIGKRMRGRPTMSGKELERSVDMLVKNAKSGTSLHDSTMMDPTAWNALKQISNKYSHFDSGDWRRKLTHLDDSFAICAIVNNDEAYIDEWADYHSELGFTIYVYDSSEEFWMRQWGKQRNDSATIVSHFPGDSVDPAFQAEVFADCLSSHRIKHKAVALIGVNDFFMFSERNGLKPIDRLLRSHQDVCIHQFERILFGHSDRFAYDPLPVTKRFMYRVNDGENSILPVLMFQSNRIPSIDTKDLLEKFL